MSRLKAESVVTLLKYLDQDFLTEEQYDEICELDISDEEQQMQVIRSVIIPGYKSLNVSEQKSMKIVLALCIDIDNEAYFGGVFVSISLPFENQIKNKRDFFETFITKF